MEEKQGRTRNIVIEYKDDVNGDGDICFFIIVTF